MKGMWTSTIQATGDFSGSLTFDFPERPTHAFVALGKYAGDGTIRQGVRKYTYKASGTTKTKKFDPAELPTYAHHNAMTSITFDIWSFEAMAVSTIVLTFW